MISCKNILCIYCNKRHKCSKKDIHINHMGVCDNCVHVKVDENEINKIKPAQQKEELEKFNFSLTDKGKLMKSIETAEGYLKSLNDKLKEME